jgi:hypothetical protein
VCLGRSREVSGAAYGPHGHDQQEGAFGVTVGLLIKEFNSLYRNDELRVWPAIHPKMVYQAAIFMPAININNNKNNSLLQQEQNNSDNHNNQRQSKAATEPQQQEAQKHQQ